MRYDAYSQSCGFGNSTMRHYAERGMTHIRNHAELEIQLCVIMRNEVSCIFAIMRNWKFYYASSCGMRDDAYAQLCGNYDFASKRVKLNLSSEFTYGARVKGRKLRE